MRRIFVLAILLLLLVPASAFAQDDQPLWDLTQEYSVPNLGLKFNYPDGWVSGTADSLSGVRFASDQADLDAMLDSDNATSPETYSISFVSLNTTALGIDADTPLDDVVTTLLKAGGITEETRTEVPVLTHRAIEVMGTNQAGRPGIATIWLQKELEHGLDMFVLFSVGAADDTNLAYSWGQILASVSPIGALEFGETPLTSMEGDFTISYPKDWFTSPDQPGGIAEVEADLTTNGDPTGAAAIVLEQSLASMGGQITDLDSLKTAIQTSQGWDEAAVPTEHIILGEPAIMFAGKNDSAPGGWMMITGFIWNENAVIIGMVFPSEEKYNEISPTFLAMLQSISSTEMAS